MAAMAMQVAGAGNIIVPEHPSLQDRRHLSDDNTIIEISIKKR